MAKQYSHEQILDAVEKYLPTFTQDSVAISRPLHHDFCIDYYFLPTLMTASKIHDLMLWIITTEMMNNKF